MWLSCAGQVEDTLNRRVASFGESTFFAVYLRQYQMARVNRSVSLLWSKSRRKKCSREPLSKSSQLIGRTSDFGSERACAKKGGQLLILTLGSLQNLTPTFSIDL